MPTVWTHTRLVHEEPSYQGHDCLLQDSKTIEDDKADKNKIESVEILSEF